MINAINIEKYCAETNNFTLKVSLKKKFINEQFRIIKQSKKCLTISNNCLLVRDQNIILHLYNDQDICIIANATTVSQGVEKLENLITLIT